jgi:hypothetical protein
MPGIDGHGICPTCYEAISAELDEMTRNCARA